MVGGVTRALRCGGADGFQRRLWAKITCYTGDEMEMWRSLRACKRGVCRAQKATGTGGWIRADLDFGQGRIQCQRPPHFVAPYGCTRCTRCGCLVSPSSGLVDNQLVIVYSNDDTIIQSLLTKHLLPVLLFATGPCKAESETKRGQPKTMFHHSPAVSARCNMSSPC